MMVCLEILCRVPKSEIAVTYEVRRFVYTKQDNDNFRKECQAALKEAFKTLRIEERKLSGEVDARQL